MSNLLIDTFLLEQFAHRREQIAHRHEQIAHRLESFSSS